MPKLHVISREKRWSYTYAAVCLLYRFLTFLFILYSRKEYFVVEDNQLREPILGRQVGQLSLERTDVTLEITNGDPESRFDITNNGMIKTKKIIDREVQDKYSLTIFAYNNAGFDSFQLDVLVEDLNDNVPTFEKGMHFLTFCLKLREINMKFFFQMILPNYLWI